MATASIIRIIVVISVAALAMAAQSCYPESITGIKDTDTLQVEIKKGDGSYSSYQVRLRTSEPYGCSGRLAYRFMNNKSREAVFDIIGVEPGDGSCEQGAVSAVETINYTTQKEFKLEIRLRKKVTRYQISRNGAQWSDTLLISDIPSEINFIEKDSDYFSAR